MYPKNIHCLAFNFPGVSTSKSTPLYFIKSASSFVRNNCKIQKPKENSLFWTEIELGIYINEDCENVSIDEAKNLISGYSVCADITCSNIDNRDHHLAYSKSRTNFCPTSLPSSNMIKDFNLTMRTFINKKLTQTGNLKDMIFNPFKAIQYISSITKLCKGDLILLGTPSGWEKNILNKGDHVIQKIEQIGSLEYEII